MTKLQKYALVLPILVLCAYPPWVYTFQPPGAASTRSPAGFASIFQPPAAKKIGSPRDSTYSGVQVDLSRFGLLAVAGALFSLVSASLFSSLAALRLQRPKDGYSSLTEMVKAGTPPPFELHHKLAAHLPKLIGKTLSGLVIKSASTSSGPQFQLFMCFSDNTYYEIYGSASLFGAGGIDNGGEEEVLRYMTPPQQVVFQAFSSLNS